MVKYKLGTVPKTPVSTKPVLCTNRPYFTMLFYYVKVTPHSSLPSSILALTEALKWGTVWTSTSSGIGIVKGQSLNFQIYLIKNTCSTLIFHNSCASWGRSSYSISLQSPVNTRLELWKLECGGTFIIETSSLKIGY